MGRQEGRSACPVSVESLIEDSDKQGETHNHLFGTIRRGVEGTGDPCGCIGMDFSNEAQVLGSAPAIRSIPQWEAIGKD